MYFCFKQFYFVRRYTILSFISVICDDDGGDDDGGDGGGGGGGGDGGDGGDVDDYSCDCCGK